MRTLYPLQFAISAPPPPAVIDSAVDLDSGKNTRNFLSGFTR
jgi:hypothetical protein